MNGGTLQPEKKENDKKERFRFFLNFMRKVDRERSRWTYFRRGPIVFCRRLFGSPFCFIELLVKELESEE